ncbi:hypothetical protein AB4097_01895 [Microvirga sp. 2MCAF35]|uniref:hypothetical protein n=1 Tax=Microvirga sp. 2MCAF35 TaxID=3232987 RepID=UPI003F98A52E
MAALLPRILALLSLLLLPAMAHAQKSQAEKTKDQTRGDMTFVALDTSSLCTDCSIVQATGTFGSETIAAYRDLVWRARLKKNSYFLFHSPGGSMKAAMELGRILRNLKVNTIVGRAYIRNGEVEIEPGTCASACLFAFAGGTTRSMPKNSRLGAHSWMPIPLLDLGQPNAKKVAPPQLSQGVVGEIHRQTADYLSYLQSMGIDLRIAVTILQTPFSSMTWVSPRNQSLWSLVTIDSSLSTAGDRRWPVLFLPSGESAASKRQLNASERRGDGPSL